MRELRVLDSVIEDEALLDECITAATYSDKYYLMHKAGPGYSSEGTQVFKSNWLLYDRDDPRDGSISGVAEIPSPFDKLWEHVKPHTGDNTQLFKVYINAHSFGTEDIIHTDDDAIPKGKTAILYLCHRWNPEWSGQTVFYNEMDIMEKDIVYSCLPKYNRMVIFDKSIPHAVAPLSRRYMGLRLTCMFKIEDLDGRSPMS